MTTRTDVEDDNEDLNSEPVNLNNEAPDDDLSSDSDYMDDEEYDEDVNGDNEEKNESRRIYVPNMSRLSKNDNTDELECDYSAYIMYHKAETGYPCLSFDVIEDALGSGDGRAKSFPLTSYLVAGTQADHDHLNCLMVLKFFNMNPIISETNDDDEEDNEDLPDLNCISIPHNGCINRVRAKWIGEKLIAANWSDHGLVKLWDITDAFKACDDEKSMASFKKQNQQIKPIQSFNGHQSSGYGLDWSPVEEGTLASGDCKKNIFIWKLTNDGWIVDQLPLNGHTDSVEDIQWSPNESNILCSCSVDRSIRIWDIRNKRQSVITIPDSHQSDVNVISWNHLEKAFILSGGDDGAIKVWDLRQVRRKANLDGGGETGNTSKPIASFKQHCGPITSVDWHKSDGTVFAASGQDHQVTQWDLAVEKDEQQQDVEEQQQQSRENQQDQSIIGELPPQLLFIHQGQKEVKEIRWHPQLPGVLISTASTGFDIFRTVSV